MSHLHSNSILLEPKEKQGLIWKFTKAQNKLASRLETKEIK